MTKRWMRWLAAMATAGLVTACGGGGGGGDSLFEDGDGDGESSAFVMSLDVQRSGTSTDTVSSTETVQAVARVEDSDGNPVRGVVVTFAESGAGLLTLAPSAGTALTDANGRATIDLSAADAANTGATTVTGNATVADTQIAASKSVQIASNGGSGGEAVPAAAAINFVEATPSGTAIVIKGSGGSGRSESAVLSFKVVDGAGAPINGATVAFTLNKSSSDAGVVLNTKTNTSDSSGIVKTTVTSGASPTTVIVTAKVTSLVTPSNATVTSQSDTIIVSTTVASDDAFEIVAAKYNLDGRKTGDSTTISAFIGDANGNPVADGVAVSFVSDAGAVGQSSSAGCTTVNGTCTVPFRVQEPRGSGLATILATVRVGNDEEISGRIRINMAGSNSSYTAFESGSTTPVRSLDLGSSCSAGFELELTDGTFADGSGRSPAAGTTITIGGGTPGITGTVSSGSPVLDVLDQDYPPVPFVAQITVAKVAPNSCREGGTPGAGTGFTLLSFTTPGGVRFTQRVDIRYPM